MAITAKLDVFPVATGTWVAVQPAAGEVWLIKSIHAPMMNASAGYFYIGLYDGVEFTPIFAMGNNSIAFDHWAGTHGAGPSTVKGAMQSDLSVIITNSVYLRYFQSGTTAYGAATEYGYSGVRLT